VEPVAAREAPRYEPESAPTPRPAPRVEEPRVNPKALLEDAGLVMVETDRSKGASAQPVAQESAPIGRPRRERPRSQPQDDELQQVETKR
jgi:hypothetical protein